MPDNKSITQAVMEGLKRGFGPDVKENDRPITASFNAASGVLKGLTLLSKLPGSKFTVSTHDRDGDFIMVTNIPTYDLAKHLFVATNPDGRITAFGEYEDALSVNVRDTGASESIVSFVAERAARNGLIPRKAMR